MIRERSIFINVPAAIDGYASYHLPGRGADSMERGFRGKSSFEAGSVSIHDHSQNDRLTSGH